MLNPQPMQHIRETAEVFPFLYYQRVFIKGYIALALPLIMAVRSEIADGYIYIRRHIHGLRLRDLDNGFARLASGGAPSGLKANPIRGIEVANTVSVDLTVKGREDAFTWVYSKDDLPRIVNSETHTEFLACVPVKDRTALPNFNLVTSYLSSFIDWYRMVTGDVSMTGADHWNSHIQIYGESLVDIRTHRHRPIDDIVIDVYPEGYVPKIFHFDVEPNETGSVNAVSDGVSHEQRIANYLASGKALPLVHRRFAEILHLAQETRDWALVVLSMYPVFEQYLGEFIKEVGERSPAFKSFVESKRKKDDIVYVGDRIKWLPNALHQLGYVPASVGAVFGELEKANQERIQVVHFNKRPSFQEAMDFARILTNTVLLCETALGNETPYVVALEKAGPTP